MIIREPLRDHASHARYCHQLFSQLASETREMSQQCRVGADTLSHPSSGRRCSERVYSALPSLRDRNQEDGEETAGGLVHHQGQSGNNASTCPR